ncbi:MAG: hypothetical protein U0835_18210 [Isosphaeraceae bacterium]
MRIPRLRFRMWWLLFLTAVLASALTVAVRYERRKAVALWNESLAQLKRDTELSEVAYRNAALTREVAEMVVSEYADQFERSGSEPKPSTNAATVEPYSGIGVDPRWIWDYTGPNPPLTILYRQLRYSPPAAQTPPTHRPPSEALLHDSIYRELVAEVGKARAAESETKVAYEKSRSALQLLLQDGPP